MNKSPRRGLFTDNKQSLPFPLGEVLKSMPVYEPHPPPPPLSHAHLHPLMLGPVGEPSKRAGLSYNKLGVHY